MNTTPYIPLALIKDDIITKAIHYLTVNEYLRMNTHLKNREKKNRCKSNRNVIEVIDNRCWYFKKYSSEYSIILGGFAEIIQDVNNNRVTDNKIIIEINVKYDGDLNLGLNVIQ